MEKRSLTNKRKLTLHAAVFRSRVAVLLVALVFVGTGVTPAYSAAEGHQGSEVTDVRFTVSGLTVIVEYDLQGDSAAKYAVSLMLRKRSDPSFRYSPKALSGDVGLGRYAGSDRKIVWDMSREFPQGLQGTGYYFVVNAEQVESHHSTGILGWIGAGAVAVAAVVTYAIVMHNGGPTSPATYPAPPGRP